MIFSQLHKIIRILVIWVNIKRINELLVVLSSCYRRTAHLCKLSIDVLALQYNILNLTLDFRKIIYLCSVAIKIIKYFLIFELHNF